MQPSITIANCTVVTPNCFNLQLAWNAGGRWSCSVGSTSVTAQDMFPGDTVYLFLYVLSVSQFNDRKRIVPSHASATIFAINATYRVHFIQTEPRKVEKPKLMCLAFLWWCFWLLPVTAGARWWSGYLCWRCWVWVGPFSAGENNIRILVGAGFHWVVVGKITTIKQTHKIELGY